MKRLSLRVRLTLLFFLLTSAAWGIACFFAWQQTTEKLDKLFDTQQLLFARRLSAMNFDELHTLTAPVRTKKKIKHGHLETTRWRSRFSRPTASACFTTARMVRTSRGKIVGKASAMAI